MNLVCAHLASRSGDATLSENAVSLFTASGGGTETTSAVVSNVLFGNGTKTVCVRGLAPPNFLCGPTNPTPQSIRVVERSRFSSAAGLPANVRGKTIKVVLDAEVNKDLTVPGLLCLLHHGTKEPDVVTDAGCCHHELNDKFACSQCNTELGADVTLLSDADARGAKHKWHWRRPTYKKPPLDRAADDDGDGNGNGASASASSSTNRVPETVTPKRKKIRATLDADSNTKDAVYMMILSAEAAKIQHHHQLHMAAAAPQLPPPPAKTTPCTPEDLAVSSAMLLLPVSPDLLRRISYRATALLHEASIDIEEDPEDDDATGSTSQSPQPSFALEALMDEADVPVDLRADTGARLAAQGFDDLAALTHYFTRASHAEVRSDLRLQPIAQTKLHMHLEQMLSED